MPEFRPLGGSAGGFRALNAPAPEATEEAQESVVPAAPAEPDAWELEREALLTRIDELEAALPRLEDVLRTVERERHAALGRARQDVAALILAMVRRVLGDSLALHPDALPRVIEEAVALMPEDETLRIRVPVDLVALLATRLPTDLHDRVVGDASVTTGCVVHNQHSSVEATLDAAMSGIELAVSEWLGELG